MHYYQFNIGDYLSHTRHLNPIEDICYRRALDYYYLHEKPLSNDVDKLSRLLILVDYQEELYSILCEFFIKTDDGFINPRADKEIKQYQEFSEAGKRGAAKRWSKVGNTPPYSPPTPPPMPNNKQEPLTTNHKTHTGEIACAIKNVGIFDINQSNPTFVALVEAGATLDEFVEAANTAKEKGKGFSYAIAIVKGRREDAANLNIHKGSMPSTKQQKRDEDLQWFLGNQPAIEKDITHG